MANGQLVLRSITPNVGTEICGVNLGQLSDAEAETIRATLIDRKVIVLRDQDITTAQYAASEEAAVDGGGGGGGE